MKERGLGGLVIELLGPRLVPEAEQWHPLDPMRVNMMPYCWAIKKLV